MQASPIQNCQTLHGRVEAVVGIVDGDVLQLEGVVAVVLLLVVTGVCRRESGARREVWQERSRGCNGRSQRFETRYSLALWRVSWPASVLTSAGALTPCHAEYGHRTAGGFGHV